VGGKSKAQTIGYKYYIGMHSVLCHGPIDRVTQLTVDDRTAWTGSSAGGSIVVNAESLFGGESREGGVSGTVDVCMGYPDQTRNSYLVAKCATDVPAYRGVVSMVFRQCYMGNNPYLKPWRFRGQRIHVRQNGIAQWYDAKAAIPVVDPNAAIAVIGDLSFPANSSSTDGSDSHFDFGVIGDSLKVEFLEPWSFTPSDSYDLGAYPKTWGFRFGLKNLDTGVVTVYMTEWWLTASAAMAANGTHPLTISLAPGNYRFFIYDATNDDNRGTGRYRLSGFPGALDMNGAHMIRECLTDPDWGMGYLEADADEASFTKAADTLVDEGLGISLLWDKQILIDAFIQEVVKHIDAALYVSRTTGKFILKLIRGDYDIEDLITLDESNIARIEDPSRPTFGELTNSVTVNYWDTFTGKNASLTITDTAMALVQGSTINVPVQYPGFTNARNASIAGQRDLRALSGPILTCTIYVDSTADALNVGDVFLLNWAKWGIYQLVMRITSFALGNGKTNQIKLTCVQDIFDTTTRTVVANPPADWDDPSKVPVPATDSLAEEAPYYELVQTLGQSQVDSALALKPESGYVMGAAPRPAGAINARLWTDNGTGYQSMNTMEFCPYCELTIAVGKLDTVLHTTGGRDMDQIVPGQHAQIGEELVRVDAVDTVANTVTIARGVLDTVPQAHAIGTAFFCWDLDYGMDPTEYLAGEVIDVKVQPVSGAGVVDLSLVTERVVTMNSRAWRAYAPGMFKINGAWYSDVPLAGELTITWAHRDRMQETGGTLVDHTMGDIGPEVGTTYRLDGYLDGVLVHTEDAIAGTSATWTPGTDGIVRIEVHAVRDGIDSWQAPWHEFYYGSGHARITEGADDRHTEEDDLIITED